MANQNLLVKTLTTDPAGAQLYIVKGGLDYRIAFTDLVNSAIFLTVLNANGHTVADTDYYIHVTYTTTGVVTITLPTDQTTVGRILTIKDAGGNASTNNITIATQGSETIDGAASYVISSNYESVTIYTDGTNWFII